MVQRGLSGFRPTDLILTHKRKDLKQEAELQHWILLLDLKTQMLFQAYAPVLMSYDCVYDSACDSFSPFDFEWCRLQFSYNQNWAGRLSSCRFETL